MSTDEFTELGYLGGSSDIRVPPRYCGAPSTTRTDCVSYAFLAEVAGGFRVQVRRTCTRSAFKYAVLVRDPCVTRQYVLSRVYRDRRQSCCTNRACTRFIDDRPTMSRPRLRISTVRGSRGRLPYSYSKVQSSTVPPFLCTVLTTHYVRVLTVYGTGTPSTQM